jgi:hypothetical protein
LVALVRRIAISVWHTTIDALSVAGSLRSMDRHMARPRPRHRTAAAPHHPPRPKTMHRSRTTQFASRPWSDPSVTKHGTTSEDERGQSKDAEPSSTCRAGPPLVRHHRHDTEDRRVHAGDRHRHVQRNDRTIRAPFERTIGRHRTGCQQSYDRDSIHAASTRTLVGDGPHGELCDAWRDGAISQGSGVRQQVAVSRLQ